MCGALIQFHGEGSGGPSSPSSKVLMGVVVPLLCLPQQWSLRPGQEKGRVVVVHPAPPHQNWREVVVAVLSYVEGNDGSGGGAPPQPIPPPLSFLIIDIIILLYYHIVIVLYY